MVKIDWHHLLCSSVRYFEVHQIPSIVVILKRCEIAAIMMVCSMHNRVEMRGTHMFRGAEVRCIRKTYCFSIRRVPHDEFPFHKEWFDAGYNFSVTL